MKKNLVEYKNPPLIETVFSVQFEPLSGSSSLLGQFYQEVKSEFPSLQDLPPLMNVIEPEFLTPQFQSLTIQFEQNSRLFMTSEDSSLVLQVQRDRFVLNWRKVENSPPYPRFSNLYPKFEELFDRFAKFVDLQKLGLVRQNQFELTYVNIIDKTNGLATAGVEALFVDHVRDSDLKNRFLPPAEVLNWQSSFAMENKLGRLHVGASSAFLNQDISRGQVMRVDLTARGIGDDFSVEGRQAWFKTAHKWVVSGFSDIISTDVQNECWGRS